MGSTCIEMLFWFLNSIFAEPKDNIKLSRIINKRIFVFIFSIYWYYYLYLKSIGFKDEDPSRSINMLRVCISYWLRPINFSKVSSFRITLTGLLRLTPLLLIIPYCNTARTGVKNFIFKPMIRIFSMYSQPKFQFNRCN